MTDKVAERERRIPKLYKAQYRRAMAGKSRTAGVDAFCAMCVGWVNVANEVRACTDPACPLYPYRPSTMP